MNAADRILEALRTTSPDAYRCHPQDPHRWLADCPACQQPMAVIEAVRHGAHTEPEERLNSAALMCAAGCTEASILDALQEALENPPDPRHAAELAAQIAITQGDHSRMQRARRAQHEVNAWHSTTTTSTRTASPATTSQKPSAAPNSRHGPPTKATPQAGSPCG